MLQLTAIQGPCHQLFHFNMCLNEFQLQGLGPETTGRCESIETAAAVRIGSWRAHSVRFNASELTAIQGSSQQLFHFNMCLNEFQLQGLDPETTGRFESIETAAAVRIDSRRVHSVRFNASELTAIQGLSQQLFHFNMCLNEFQLQGLGPEGAKALKLQPQCELAAGVHTAYGSMLQSLW